MGDFPFAILGGVEPGKSYQPSSFGFGRSKRPATKHRPGHHAMPIRYRGTNVRAFSRIDGAGTLVEGQRQLDTSPEHTASSVTCRQLPRRFRNARGRRNLSRARGRRVNRIKSAGPLHRSATRPQPHDDCWRAPRLNGAVDLVWRQLQGRRCRLSPGRFGDYRAELSAVR